MIFVLGKALGHHCGTVCLGIANRLSKDFSKDINNNMMGLVEYVLDRL